MSGNKPTHTAYVVPATKEGEDKKAFWREVGAIWPHKDGKGYDLVIHEGIAVNGKIVIRERKEGEKEAA